MLGRFGQFLHGLYNTQIFDLEADLNFEKDQRQLFAQFEAAGEMKREQQSMLSNQATGGYGNNNPYAFSASFSYSFNRFFGSVLKWVIFIALVCLGIGTFVRSKATLSTGGFLLAFSIVYLFYTQGPTQGRFYVTSFPFFVATVVGVVTAILLAVLGDRLFKSIHGSDADAKGDVDRDEAVRQARKL